MLFILTFHYVHCDIGLLLDLSSFQQGVELQTLKQSISA
jgi:hypothetical protein